jgi:hypothetical protein
MYQQPASRTSQPQNQTPVPTSTRRIQAQRERTTRGLIIGCLIVPLGIVLFIVFTLLFAHFKDQHPPILFQRQDVVSEFQIAAMVTTVCACVFFIAALVSWNTPMNKLGRGWVILFTSVWLVTFLAFPPLWMVYNALHSNIGMTRTGFLVPSLSISYGDHGDGLVVHFYNPPDGVKQILCVGVDQHCQKGSDDPAQLDRGLIMQPGQVVNVTFDMGGTYQITSETTPSMNMTISVDDGSDD